MSEDEKKFKLDELPDEGSKSSLKIPKKKIDKPGADPRLEKLKFLSERQKTQVMTQTWKFDKSVLKYGWTIYIVVLGYLQYIRPYEQYLREIKSMNDYTMELGGDTVQAFTVVLEFLIKNPILLSLLTPLFFKFTRASDYFFEITFDGVKTVKEVLPVGSKELVSRTFIKWKDITGVEKALVGNREVLRIFSPDGKAAEVIWDIDTNKKKAIKLILNGLINNQHPLRMFLENEKDL